LHLLLRSSPGDLPWPAMDDHCRRPSVLMWVSCPPNTHPMFWIFLVVEWNTPLAGISEQTRTNRKGKKHKITNTKTRNPSESRYKHTAQYLTLNPKKTKCRELDAVSRRTGPRWSKLQCEPRDSSGAERLENQLTGRIFDPEGRYPIVAAVED